MFIAAQGQAAQSPGAPVIVPTDPPGFKGCIAQARKLIPQLAKTAEKQLKSDCNQLFTQLNGQVLDFLIKSYWYQAEAVAQHVKVTDADVQKAFNAAKQQRFPTDTAFQTFLKQTGQTLSDILYRVRVNQIYTKLISKRTTKVTPAVIETYYSSHLATFGSPEARDIRIVRTKSRAQAQAAKGALSSGQSWDAVAKKYSVDTTKSSGGLLKGVTKGQEEQALDTAAFAAPQNKLLGPIQGQFGFYVFEVTKIKRSTQQSLAQATPQIQQLLTAQAQTSAQNAVDSTAKSHWQHKTSCRKAFSMMDCAGVKATSSSSTPTPTPAPTPPPTTT
jgi:foldase protein PrsA